MGVYRIQVPAAIVFSVTASSPEQALVIAETIRLDNDDEGWDIDLTLDGEFLDDAGARAYIDSGALREPLTEHDIIDVEEEQG